MYFPVMDYPLGTVSTACVLSFFYHNGLRSDLRLWAGPDFKVPEVV